MIALSYYFIIYKTEVHNEKITDHYHLGTAVRDHARALAGAGGGIRRGQR
jgi:hypothetical protein